MATPATRSKPLQVKASEGNRPKPKAMAVILDHVKDEDDACVPLPAICRRS